MTAPHQTTKPPESVLHAFANEVGPLPETVSSAWCSCEPHQWHDTASGIEPSEGRSNVICAACLVPGERDDETGEVFWPAT